MSKRLRKYIITSKEEEKLIKRALKKREEKIIDYYSQQKENEDLNEIEDDILAYFDVDDEWYHCKGYNYYGETEGLFLNSWKLLVDSYLKSDLIEDFLYILEDLSVGIICGWTKETKKFDEIIKKINKYSIEVHNIDINECLEEIGKTKRKQYKIDKKNYDERKEEQRKHEEKILKESEIDFSKFDKKDFELWNKIKKRLHPSNYLRLNEEVYRKKTNKEIQEIFNIIKENELKNDNKSKEQVLKEKNYWKLDVYDLERYNGISLQQLTKIEISFLTFNGIILWKDVLLFLKDEIDASDGFLDDEFHTGGYSYSHVGQEGNELQELTSIGVIKPSLDYDCNLGNKHYTHGCKHMYYFHLTIEGKRFIDFMNWHNEHYTSEEINIIKNESLNYFYYDPEFKEIYQEYLQLRKKEEYKIEENEEILQISKIKKLGYSKSYPKEKIYKSDNWKIRSEEIRKRDSQIDLLRLFDDGIITKSEPIHHIFPIKFFPEIALEPYNLIALDISHHKSIYKDYRNPLDLFKRMIEIHKIWRNHKKKYGEKILMKIISIISRQYEITTNLEKIKTKKKNYTKELGTLTKKIDVLEKKTINNIKKILPI